jgi:hypothetical protein
MASGFAEMTARCEYFCASAGCGSARGQISRQGERARIPNRACSAASARHRRQDCDHTPLAGQTALRNSALLGNAVSVFRYGRWVIAVPAMFSVFPVLIIIPDMMQLAPNRRAEGE